jgi:hypothetical protein
MAHLEELLSLESFSNVFSLHIYEQIVMRVIIFYYRKYLTLMED